MDICIDNLPIKTETNFSLENWKDIKICWNAKGLHTLMIYDINMSNYLHLLIVNIPGNDILSGNVLISYEPPTQKNKIEHRYVFEIYKQKYELNIRKNSRLNFRIDQFIEKNELTLFGNDTLVLNFNTSKFKKQGAKQVSRVSSKSPSRVSRVSKTSKVSKSPSSHIIIPNTDLTEREQKYCSCLIDVAAKQPESCITEKAWFKKKDGKVCYNPYAICAKSTKTSSRKCSANYNYEAMSDDQLIAYADFHNVKLPKPFKRDKLISTIYEKLKSLGKK
jgi:hypothetical protein